MTQIKISNKNLREEKYDRDTLIYNIDNLSHKTILATQKLDAEFCIKYILDMDIDSGDEYSYLFDINYILLFQKHLTKNDLLTLYTKYI
jgi:hypothetical protein